MMPSEKNTKRVILALDQAYEKFTQLEDESTDEAEIVAYRCYYTNIYESKLYVEQMQKEIDRLKAEQKKKSERQMFIAHEDGTIEPVTYQKEQQPKLLTLKETINAKYPMDVFCEIKGEERIFAVTAPVPAQWIGKPDIRYWTARPTEEQRKAVPWKEDEKDG